MRNTTIKSHAEVVQNSVARQIAALNSEEVLIHQRIATMEIYASHYDDQGAAYIADKARSSFETAMTTSSYDTRLARLKRLNERLALELIVRSEAASDEDLTTVKRMMSKGASEAMACSITYGIKTVDDVQTGNYREYIDRMIAKMKVQMRF